MEHFQTAMIGKTAVRGKKPVKEPLYPPVIYTDLPGIETGPLRSENGY
jgi:hypothetical protein